MIGDGQVQTADLATESWFLNSSITLCARGTCYSTMSINYSIPWHCSCIHFWLRIATVESILQFIIDNNAQRDRLDSYKHDFFDSSVLTSHPSGFRSMVDFIFPTQKPHQYAHTRQHCVTGAEIAGQDALVFEGANANGYETTIRITEPYHCFQDCILLVFPASLQ